MAQITPVILRQLVQLGTTTADKITVRLKYINTCLRTTSTDHSDPGKVVPRKVFTAYFHIWIL